MRVIESALTKTLCLVMVLFKVRAFIPLKISYLNVIFDRDCSPAQMFECYLLNMLFFDLLL